MNLPLFDWLFLWLIINDYLVILDHIMLNLDDPYSKKGQKGLIKVEKVKSLELLQMVWNVWAIDILPKKRLNEFWSTYFIFIVICQGLRKFWALSWKILRLSPYHFTMAIQKRDDILI